MSYSTNFFILLTHNGCDYMLAVSGSGHR